MFSHAGFWKRSLAALIDLLLLGLVGYVVGLLFGYDTFRNSFEGLSRAQETGARAAFAPTPIPVLVANTLIFVAYHTVMESSSLMGSFGKVVLGACVTDVRGQRISWVRAAWRITPLALLNALGNTPLLPIISIVGLVNVLMVAFTPNKQAGHDMLAGCLVVNRSSLPATDSSSS